MQPRGHSYHGSSIGHTMSSSTADACLIDFSSPPHSPTTGSGSDGLSINSFGSESSGTHSGGFDDNFDPFGSIQEENLKIDPFGSIEEEEIGVIPTKNTGSSTFYGLNVMQNNLSSIQNNSTSFNGFINSNNSDDPFEMIALRTQLPNLSTSQPAQQTNQPNKTINNQIQQLSSQVKISQSYQHRSFDESSTTTVNNGGPPKSNFKATIIRPNTGSTTKSQGSIFSMPQSTSMPTLLDEELEKNEEVSIPSLLDDAPPLPPRPADEVSIIFFVSMNFNK